MSATARASGPVAATPSPLAPARLPLDFEPLPPARVATNVEAAPGLLSFTHPLTDGRPARLSYRCSYAYATGPSWYGWHLDGIELDGCDVDGEPVDAELVPDAAGRFAESEAEGNFRLEPEDDYDGE